MFCGSGTVPLEAALLGRKVFAADNSEYAITLTRGKLYAPACQELAARTLNQLLDCAKDLPFPDLRRVPGWVREFFHAQTLKEALRLTRFLREKEQDFLLGSMLGILHHQRPGFLSYPSSHLVPYLRSRKFPKSDFPSLYDYRPVEPRLRAKVQRALRRAPRKSIDHLISDIRLCSVRSLVLPDHIDCVITSPPYMNALDYRRDNRLRLWFLDESPKVTDDKSLATPAAFEQLTKALAEQLSEKVRKGGACIFIVGEKTFRGGKGFPSEILLQSFQGQSSTFRLEKYMTDIIPDIRRSRRHLSGVKREDILVFRKH